MTLIDFDKKELTDIAHALLCYRTDMTIRDFFTMAADEIREEEEEEGYYD